MIREVTKIENKSMQAVFSAAAAALAVYLGAISVPVVVLLIMMVVDYLTGMTAAWMHNKLSSKIGAKGILKKVGYMALIVVAAGVDYLIWSGVAAVQVDVGYKMWFGLLVTIWLIINEMISTLENLDKIGVPLPEFLIKVIKRLKNSIDKNTKEENKNGGNNKTNN